MNFRNIKNTVVVLAMIGTSLLPSVKAEATGLSEVVSAGVAVTMEHSDDEVVLATAVAPSVVEGYTVLGVVKAESGYINIREEANTESKVVGKIAKNAICEVVSTEGEWFERAGMTVLTQFSAFKIIQLGLLIKLPAKTNVRFSLGISIPAQSSPGIGS